jgi:Zn-dependent protease
MFGMPSTTAYDLRFRALGIPVRVHPFFWLFSAMLGPQDRGLGEILTWVLCVFVSILVHEYGHGLMGRAFGHRASIVLYGFGGLCYSEAERQSPGQRLAVLFAGPGAGFLLAGLLLGGYFAAGSPELNPTASEVFSDLIFINIVWGILNLLPIVPLDGGRIADVLFNLISRRNGTRWAHVLSLLTAALMAFFMFSIRQIYSALFFIVLAAINYQALQAIHHQYLLSRDDEEWWRQA